MPGQSDIEDEATGPGTVGPDYCAATCPNLLNVKCSLANSCYGRLAKVRSCLGLLHRDGAHGTDCDCRGGTAAVRLSLLNVKCSLPTATAEGVQRCRAAAAASHCVTELPRCV